MISVMRTKFGPKVIGGIVAVIAGIFIFSGVFLPGQGSQAPSIAGEVNGEIVSFTEFSRALNQRIEYFKSMMGGKINEEQIAGLRMREAVFQDLAQRKVLVQVAKKEGFYPSAEQIRDTILKMDAFKKEGRFDKLLYKNVLNQNQLTPGRFEDLVGADLMEQNFRTLIGSLAQVSSSEVESYLESSKNRMKLKYLYVDHESLRKLMPKEKAPSFDAFTVEMEKKILPLVNSGNTAQLSKLLQDNKIKIVSSDWLTEQNEFIPGVGSIRTIKNDLKSMKKGDSSKALRLVGGTLFAKVTDLEGYQPAKVTSKERSEAYSRLLLQKQNEIFSDLMKSWTKKAKINRNDRVVVGNAGSNVPVGLEE